MSMVPKSPRHNCYFGCKVKGNSDSAPTTEICMELPTIVTDQNSLLNEDDEMPISPPTSPDVCMEVADQDTDLNEAFLEGKCICCLKEGDLQNLWEPYVYEGVTEIYGEMLSECYTLTPQSEDNLQSIEMICHCCIKRLRDALSFRREVMSSAQMLQNYRKKLLLHTKEEEDPLKLKMESQCENIENINITKVKDQSTENSRSVGLFQIKCFHRPKKFIGTNKLQLNQKTNKEREKIKICEYCGKKFDWFQDYVTHMKITHGIKKSFKYKDCAQKILNKQINIKQNMHYSIKI
ncbi:PREDICTED: uncharacterized protein LOC106103905 isoform X2 [Papilio polytes]|uniref:uncharacterized protein LOC106103905 isoform X2 n=1 Tax=Papilio polytes TaxID=76194 RepID=UPI000675FB0D|nr:PREDICTED: uncharacterized protein LOC106103905 isoform X2 [Papilio polytes]